MKHNGSCSAIRCVQILKWQQPLNQFLRDGKPAWDEIYDLDYVLGTRAPAFNRTGCTDGSYMVFHVDLTLKAGACVCQVHN